MAGKEKSLYSLDEKKLEKKVLRSPEVLLRATSYEIDDTLFRLSSEAFTSLFTTVPREVVSHVVMSVSVEGAFVLFFRMDDSVITRFINFLSPSQMSRIVSLLMASVSPEIIMRRLRHLGDDITERVLSSLDRDTLSRFLMGLSPSSLRPILETGSVLIDLPAEVLIHVLGAYRMGDMKKWGVYITKTLLEDIPIPAWKVLAPRLDGGDWNVLFTALSEDRIVELLRILDRRTLKRLIRRIDRDILMAFIMTSYHRLADFLDISHLGDLFIGDTAPTHMALHLYTTDRSRALEILERVPPGAFAAFIKVADDLSINRLINVWKDAGMFEEMLYSLPGDVSFILYKRSPVKEISPSLLYVWLKDGISADGVVPRPFVCRLLENLRGESLREIKPSSSVSLCIFEKDLYTHLPPESLWDHLMVLPPSHPIISTLSISWNDAPESVIRHHKDALLEIFRGKEEGIPPSLLSVLFTDDIPDNIPDDAVRRWAFSGDVDVPRAVDVLINRGMYKDAYTLMKDRGDIRREFLLPEVLIYADKDFLEDLILMGFAPQVIEGVWNRLDMPLKVMALLYTESEKRMAFMDTMTEDELWEVIEAAEDPSVIHTLLDGISISAQSLIDKLGSLSPHISGAVADHVDDPILLLRHWPHGVFHSTVLRNIAGDHIDDLPDDVKVYLICSGDVPFDDRFSDLVGIMSAECIREIPSAWKYIGGDTLLSLLKETGNTDISLWKKVFEDMGESAIKDAPLPVRLSLYEEGLVSCSVFTEEETVANVEDYPFLARCLPPHRWNDLLPETLKGILPYITADALLHLSDKNLRYVVNTLGEDVFPLLEKAWGRKKALRWLAANFPEILIKVMGREDVPYVKDRLSGGHLKAVAMRFPVLFIDRLCEIPDLRGMNVPLEGVKDINTLRCLLDSGASVYGKVRIPLPPDIMNTLWESGYVDEDVVKESLHIYGKDYIREGYLPDISYISYLKPESAEDIYTIVKNGWWNYISSEDKMQWLTAVNGVDFELLHIDEDVAAALLERGKISPYAVAHLGYSHLLEDSSLSPQEAFYLYKDNIISVEEAFRLSPEISLYLSPDDISTLVEEGILSHVHEKVIPHLRPRAILSLIKSGVEVPYDVLPPDFMRFLVDNPEEIEGVKDVLPERAKGEVLKLLLESDEIVPGVWSLVSDADVSFIRHTVVPRILKKDVKWEDVNSETLARLIGISLIDRNQVRVLLRSIPSHLLKEAVSNLSPEDVSVLVISARDILKDMLRGLSPSDIKSSPSLYAFLPLVDDDVLSVWLEKYPEGTIDLVSKGVLSFVMEKPCILGDMKEEGIRRLFDIAPEDVVLSLIARMYRECRDAYERVLILYSHYTSLRPSEIMVLAGLVKSGR